MNMKNVLYFAYGSNLSFNQIQARIGYLGDVTPVKSFKLMGWKLVFNAGHWYAEHTYANIVKGNKNDYVEGMLYQINASQHHRMGNYEILYHQYFFDVDADNIASVYIASGDDCVIDKKRKRYRFDNPGLPTLSYLNTCITGCQDHDLFELEEKFQQIYNEVEIERRNLGIDVVTKEYYDREFLSD